MVGRTVGGLMLFSASSAGIRCSRAATSNVTVSLALHATDGFFFVLADSNTLVSDTKSIPQDIIRGGCISNLEKSESLTLTWGAASGRFDPSDSRQGVSPEAVLPFYPMEEVFVFDLCLDW